MIDRAILRPFTRHKAETLTIAYGLVSVGHLSRYYGRHFSINGARNVQMANIMLETISSIAHDGCVLTGSHDIVSLDPLLSLEFFLHPSNINKYSFEYASRVSSSPFVESVSCVVSDYGRLCHILGSSICLSLTDIRAMCLSEGVGVAICNVIVSLMQNWLFHILQKSRPDIEIQPDDVIDCNVELEVVLAFFFGLRSADSICNDGTMDIDTIKKIGNIVHKLWELLFYRSTEYGGPVFCLFKLASAMSIIKSALIFTSVIDGVYGTGYRKVISDNIFVCFRFTCNKCSHGTGAEPCGKHIIVGSSSNDEICTAINSIVTASSSPMKALSSLLSCMQSTEWLDNFTWFDLPTESIVENLKRDLILPCEMIERRDAPRLTSLAIKSIPNISSSDMPSLMVLMENGFGACCVQRDEGSNDSKVCLKDSFMTAMKYYELFFEAQMKSIKRYKWDKWIKCVDRASPHRGLSEDDVYCFISFIAGLCIFPRHRECIMKISFKVMHTINSLWCSGMSKICASRIANAVVSLCEGSLFLCEAESDVLRSWLKDNMYVGANSVKRPRNSLVDGFEECYRRGRFLLPHEM